MANAVSFVRGTPILTFNYHSLEEEADKGPDSLFYLALTGNLVGFMLVCTAFSLLITKRRKAHFAPHVLTHAPHVLTHAILKSCRWVLPVVGGFCLMIGLVILYMAWVRRYEPLVTVYVILEE